MRQIFAIAVVAFSAAAIASGQEQGAIRDPKSIAEQVIRKLDNERIQAQIHADVAALERIYADDFIGDIREYVDAELALAPPQLPRRAIRASFRRSDVEGQERRWQMVLCGAGRLPSPLREAPNRAQQARRGYSA